MSLVWFRDASPEPELFAATGAVRAVAAQTLSSPSCPHLHRSLPRQRQDALDGADRSTTKDNPLEQPIVKGAIPVLAERNQAHTGKRRH
jgi:hypothetical protein